MAGRIICGIDIGTYQVKVVVAEHGRGKDSLFPKILGVGYAESKGLHHGYIVSGPETTRSVAAAVAEAERASGLSIRRAYLSVGGVGLDEASARGEAVVSRADFEVTDLDVEVAIQSAEKKIKEKVLNRKVIHSIPTVYFLDGTKVLGKPQGMKGTKLEVDALFITCLESHLDDLISSVEEAGVAVEDVIASPLAASFVTLTKADKKAGCVLANIGSETVSIVVFEDSLPHSIKVFPLGGTDITHDIALGLKISLQEAEQIKVGSVIGASYSRKKLDDIIAARLSDIFELIDAHLKRLGRSGLLPAGIIITGGSSGLATIEDIARVSLKLPSRLYTPQYRVNSKIRDSSWAVAYGLTIWGLTAEKERPSTFSGKNLRRGLTAWFRQFLP